MKEEVRGIVFSPKLAVMGVLESHLSSVIWSKASPTRLKKSVESETGGTISLSTIWRVLKELVKDGVLETRKEGGTSEYRLVRKAESDDSKSHN